MGSSVIVGIENDPSLFCRNMFLLAKERSKKNYSLTRNLNNIICFPTRNSFIHYSATTTTSATKTTTAAATTTTTTTSWRKRRRERKAMIAITFEVRHDSIDQALSVALKRTQSRSKTLKITRHTFVQNFCLSGVQFEILASKEELKERTSEWPRVLSDSSLFGMIMRVPSCYLVNNSFTIVEKSLWIWNMYLQVLV